MRIRVEIGTIAEFFPSKKNRKEWQGYIKLDKPMWDIFFKYYPEKPQVESKPTFCKSQRVPKIGDRIMVEWVWSKNGPYAKRWGFLEDWERVNEEFVNFIINTHIQWYRNNISNPTS